MADTVRNLMELMVPELEDYERRGYFSRPEITSIVKRRQNFEYSLRRRNAVKIDFLRCARCSACVHRCDRAGPLAAGHAVVLVFDERPVQIR